MKNQATKSNLLIIVLALLFTVILLSSCAVEDHNCRDWRVYHQSNGPIH